MAVNLSPVGGVAAQFFTNTGAVLTGGKLYTYAAGTTTPAVTYTSSNGFTPWTNPIVLDAAGRVSGSGEIWLTDGINYKFVLKDSTDVLIATYDNISGINSNFVAYTNSQEIQTATAGQTVFTLTTMQYQAGTNSLSVFVDGVNQYGPGAQYAYTETSSTSVTFTNGLHVGAVVKFTSTQQQGAGVVNAAQVTYEPPFTGSVVTNVESKLAQTVSVTDFGAVGDGSIDDTDAIQAALDYLSTNGGIVYAPQGEYRLTAKITIPSWVKFEGQNWRPNAVNGFEPVTKLLIDWGSGQNNHAIEMSSSSAIEGFQIQYPGQVDKDMELNGVPQLAPVEFGFSISTPTASGAYDNIQVKNIMLFNSYRGVRLNNGGRWTVENLQGEPLFIGFTASDCFDVCYMNHVHFWPFNTAQSYTVPTSPALANWKYENGTAFDLLRVDQLFASKLFAFGYNIGYNCRDGLWANFTDILTDTVQTPFKQVLASRVRVTNFEFLGSPTVKPAVWYEDGGILEFNNGYIPDNTCVGMQIGGSSGTVLVNNVKFADRVTSIVSTGTGVSVKVNNCSWAIPPLGIGNVTIEGQPLPDPSTSVTLPTPLITPTVITGGYQFDLDSTGLQYLQYDVTAISQRNSLYVFAFDYELTAPASTWYYTFTISTDVGTFTQVQIGNTYPLILNTTVDQPTRRVYIPFFINFGETLQTMTLIVNSTVASTGAKLQLTAVELFEQQNKLITDAQVAMMMKQGYNLDAYDMGQTLQSKGKNRIVLTKPEPSIGRTTEVPTAGTWAVGDQVLVHNPVSGGPIGYVCTTAGTPGTWKAFGTIA